MPIIKWLDNETDSLLDAYKSRQSKCLDAASAHHIRLNSTICPTMWDGAVCWPPLEHVGRSTIAIQLGHSFTQNCSYETLGMHTIGMQTAQCSMLSNKPQWLVTEHNCSIEAPDDDDKSILLIHAITQIGYSISMVSLVPAVFIFCFVTQLHCTRNFIHTNLMLSFILRGFFFTLQHNTESNLMAASNKNELKYLTEITGGELEPQYDDLTVQILHCKLLQIFLLFSYLANSFWLLNEGIYLYNILVFSVFKSNERMAVYNIIGWLVPSIISAICYVRLHNSGQSFCWNNDGDTRIWTDIIEKPTGLCSLINFLIFVRMIKIMVKMVEQQSYGSMTSDTVRLLKSILMLFALLGLKNMFFLIVLLEQRGHLSTLQQVAGISDTVIGSFEGFIIALLYCFLNAEVQAEIGRKFRNWHLTDHSYGRHRRSTRSSLSLPSAIGKTTGEVNTDKVDIAMRVSVEHDSGIESNRESLEISRSQHTTRPSFI